MACPSGCLNGGGQLRPEDGQSAKDLLKTVTELYEEVPRVSVKSDSAVERLYQEWLGGPDSEKAKSMLHTQYHEVEKINTALNIKW